MEKGHMLHTTLVWAEYAMEVYMLISTEINIKLVLLFQCVIKMAMVKVKSRLYTRFLLTLTFIWPFTKGIKAYLNKIFLWLPKMIFQLQPAASCDEKLVIVQPGSINHLYGLVDCVYRNDLQRTFLNICFFFCKTKSLFSSPLSLSIPRYHTADKSQLSGGECCSCPDGVPE